MFVDYLARGWPGESALASMLTGTGKSAVIGELIDRRANGRDVLILAPRKGLVQLPGIGPRCACHVGVASIEAPTLEGRDPLS
jgi:hypothetical protein